MVIPYFLPTDCSSCKAEAGLPHSYLLPPLLQFSPMVCYPICSIINTTHSEGTTPPFSSVCWGGSSELGPHIHRALSGQPCSSLVPGTGRWWNVAGLAPWEQRGASSSHLTISIFREEHTADSPQEPSCSSSYRQAARQYVCTFAILSACSGTHSLGREFSAKVTVSKYLNNHKSTRILKSPCIVFLLLPSPFPFTTSLPALPAPYLHSEKELHTSTTNSHSQEEEI